MRSASATASSTTTPDGTTRFTSPRSNARAASMGSPVIAISNATAMGSRLGMRSRPPAPAIRPRLASGMPNMACSAATTRSHEEHDLETAGQGGAVHRGNERLGEVALGQPAEAAAGPHDVAALAAAEGLEVHAGAESLVAAPRHDDHPTVGILGQLVHETRHGQAHRPVDGVARLGTVDGEDLDMPHAFPQHYVGHGGLPSSPGLWHGGRRVVTPVEGLAEAAGWPRLRRRTPQRATASRRRRGSRDRSVSCTPR